MVYCGCRPLLLYLSFEAFEKFTLLWAWRKFCDKAMLWWHGVWTVSFRPLFKNAFHKQSCVYYRCFCSDEHGNRIFGFDWRNRAANMTCGRFYIYPFSWPILLLLFALSSLHKIACSRYRDKLEKSEGRLDVTLHCDRNGNYERLQCDSGICWCAEPTTGLLAYNTRAVPAAMWRALPCCEFLYIVQTN